MKMRIAWGAALLLVTVAAGPARAQTPETTPLHDGWQLQSSAKVTDTGATVSTTAFHPDDWYRASVPSTVLGTLIENKVYADPMVGMNLRSIPGTAYPIGRNFSSLPMPDDSPFRVSWWYRTSFTLPNFPRGRHVALNFDGINYRANIWLNGRQIAQADAVAGTYRLYQFDISTAVTTAGPNILAVQIFPPEPDDLAWTWVDWNPAPPDKDMGLWRPVSITTYGDVSVRHPLVTAKVAADGSASLMASAELRNVTDRAIHGTLRGRIETTAFEQPVDLGPLETKIVKFTPDRFAALRLSRPRLWWPFDMGTPNLYQGAFDFVANGQLMDRVSVRFGVREITSTIGPAGGRQFLINGRPILIRGGGWAPDMLLRPNAARQDAELGYVRDLHLNTIRLEGKLEDDRFFDRADELGILVLAGWSCCDYFEQWAKWKPGTREIAAASQHDQILRLRGHASLLVWLNGSDNPPPADVEKMYVDILKDLDWPNPYLSSATARRTTVTGETGVKMTGPYDWVPPVYWSVDRTHGGAVGFNTETSPGPAIPPIESLRAMLPSDHLWPIDDVWNFHAGGGQFKTVKTFTDAQDARYGASSSVEEFSMKAQVMTYEGERAMFEAYARSAPSSTGVIQWMLNNAWPSMIWHLYDYYLRPGGGYFGTKKACEPVHVQYSYADRTIIALNGSGRAITGATIAVRVLNFDLSERFATTRIVNLPAGGRDEALVVPQLQNLSPAYFLDLRLRDTKGQTLSSNFYWLSTSPDTLDFPKSTYFVTPVTSFSDMTSLQTLPRASVTVSIRQAPSSGKIEKDDEAVRVRITNRGKSLAFFMRLQLWNDGSGAAEVLPVLWEDNDMTLLPGETRDILATYKVKDRTNGRLPSLTVQGWNVAQVRATISTGGTGSAGGDAKR